MRFKRLIVLLLCSSPLVWGCAGSYQREIVEPDNAATLDGRSKYLKAHARNGNTYILHDWDYDEASHEIRGTGDLVDPNRKILQSGEFEFAADSVALFETNTTGISPALAALTVITGVSVAVTIYCAQNPKACFGSCPTFYVSNGSEEVLRAEGFSASIAPVLEATDVDALYDVDRSARRLDVHMRNEALETHVVRRVDLLAAPRPKEGRVFATSNSEFWSATEVIEPAVCWGPEGDCLEILRATDGIERYSAADSSDLADRETISLTFPAPQPAEGPLGLVIGSRQTLVSTYLLYQALAWMGDSAGSYLASLERGNSWVTDRLTKFGESMGAIRVFVRDGRGEWVAAGHTQETGPLATDVRFVPLPKLPDGPVEVRIEMTRGYWRLDSVCLARLLQPVEPIRLSPIVVHQRNSGQDDAMALAALLDPAKTLVTQPGDEYTLSYELPPHPETYELFLESRGYYLEWIRAEWMAEQDHARLAGLFMNPHQALRKMAREFKDVEPDMEDQFWGSKYARK